MNMHVNLYVGILRQSTTLIIKSIGKKMFIYTHTVLIVSITVTNLHKSLDIGMVTVLQ